MRILYWMSSLGVGGAERLVVQLAERMAARGHRVKLVVLLGEQAEEWPTALEVEHLGMSRRPWALLAALGRGWRAWCRFRPDLVHSHTFPANLSARLLSLLLPRTALLSTIHNVYEGGWGRMLAYRLTDRLARRTTAVSRAAAERFVWLKAVSAERCLVLANWIDVEQFQIEPGRRQAVREKMGAGEDFIWLAAGRLTPAKDFSNLLKAGRWLRAPIADKNCEFDKSDLHWTRQAKQEKYGRSRCCQTQFWIAGDGSEEARAGLEAEARALGLEGCVRLLGLRRDLAALMEAADGFVLSSAWEGMPLVVGEAMAMARPVVATDAGGTAELVGETGLMVPVGDSPALAGAMARVMELSADDRAAMGQAARARVVDGFSLTARAEDWARLYGELVFENKPI